MEWLKIVYYTSMVLAFIASVRAYKYRKYILFIPLLAISLVVELLREKFMPFSGPVKDDIAAAYTIIEYALLSYIISNFLYSVKKKLLIRLSILVLVPLFIFIELTIADNSETYKYLCLLIESPFICVWTILYLFETARQDEEFEITRNPMFWISLGNLLFFSGSFFSYGFGGYLMEKGSTKMAESVFWIARILNILLYILYFIGFLCLKKKT